MIDVNLVGPVGGSHPTWIVHLAWFNFLVIRLILGIVRVRVIIASRRSGFRPKRLCNKRLEWWWSFIPIVIISFLDCPNLIINYLREKNPFPVYGAKVIGLQWY